MLTRNITRDSTRVEIKEIKSDMTADSLIVIVQINTNVPVKDRTGCSQIYDFL